MFNIARYREVLRLIYFDIPVCLDGISLCCFHYNVAKALGRLIAAIVLALCFN